MSKERLERIKQYYSCMNVLEPDLQEDIKWLIKRVEELQLEVNDWRDEAIKWNKRFEESEESHLETKELLRSTIRENKRYKQALEEILNADCNLEGLDAERELDRVTDIALKALEGEE